MSDRVYSCCKGCLFNCGFSRWVTPSTVSIRKSFVIFSSYIPLSLSLSLSRSLSIPLSLSLSLPLVYYPCAGPPCTVHGMFVLYILSLCTVCTILLRRRRTPPSWCPHCQQFRSQYIAMSNALAALGPIQVDTFAVSCVPFKNVCQHAHIHSYPTVRWYPPYSTNGTKLLHTDLVSATRIYAKFVPQAATMTTMTNMTTTRSASRTRQHTTRPKTKHQNNENKQKNPNPKPTPNHYYTTPRTHDDTFRDAHVSFDFAMHTAIYTTTSEEAAVGPLDDVKQQVLQDFLRVLHRTLPRSAYVPIGMIFFLSSCLFLFLLLRRSPRLYITVLLFLFCDFVFALCVWYKIYATGRTSLITRV